MAALRVLSIAVASGRAGYVFMQGTQLLDWGITVKGVKTGNDLVGFVQKLVNDLKPDVVVTEKCDDRCRKGGHSRELIASIAELASHNEVLDVSVPRPRNFTSKYEEATHLVKRYPDVAGYLPECKRRIFEFEPRGMIIFEAVALAEAVILGPPDALAAAMG
ncbi:hypothetical protein [Roseovarius aestuarii]|uniref:Uncharacterized protein n=1 Tax=Roseovarius aestuarii TaxID=475083 RepID=A0A1X7BQ96_9RHOB|nr:hypothetical protein [Roseovarius aestuarii]SMC11818.1 hypothetical protein ROA7745_01637 [Roseovarius aestuarii]